MKRLALIATVLGLFAASTPAGACAAADDPCLNDPLVAPVTGQTWFDYDADGAFDPDEASSRMAGGWVWADYNRDGQRQERETMVRTESDGRYRLPVDTRRMAAGETTVLVRFGYEVGARVWDYSPQCVAPAEGCVREVTVEAGLETTDVSFPSVGVAQLSGTIWDDKNENGRREAGEDGIGGFRVFLDDNENGQADPGEPAMSYRTVIGGHWSLPVPTRYQAAGGRLPPLVLERPAGADCTSEPDCKVTGLRTRTGLSQTVDFGVARPVVIFSHGYGGARIVCGDDLLWFDPIGGQDLKDMRLGVDGENLTVGAGGNACSQSARVDGLVMDVAGQDIYGSASRHLKGITWAGRHYDYVWDWRKDPTTAVPGLDALVERARREHGVSKVVLVGHSMGGLVMRHYIDNPAYAAKVSRAVTVGTPYWGSPKVVLPLAAGIEVPWFSGMDLLMTGSGLKAASRSFPGHFALAPAFGYGRWLRVSGLNGGNALDMDGVRQYFQSIGIDPDMYTDAAAQHGRVLDHFEDNGVDYHVIVGGGVPTIGSVRFDYGIVDELSVEWVSGDKTVPMFSAAHDTPADRLHVVCGIEHVPITAVPETTRLMDRFLIRAEPMIDVIRDCEWTGREVTTYSLAMLSPMAGAAQAGKAAKVIAGGRAHSLADAEKAGLVQVIQFGGATKIVAKGGTDVRLELPAGGTATVRELSGKGASAPKHFVGATSIALGGSGAVTGKGGKALKPVAKDTKAPKTTAKLRGGKLVLRARDASKVAGTFVVVNGKRRAYKQPLKLTAKQLRKTTYGSVDVWGNAEAPRKAPRR